MDHCGFGGRCDDRLFSEERWLTSRSSLCLAAYVNKEQSFSRQDCFSGILQQRVPLFADPRPPPRMSRPAASLSVVVPHHGQKQDIRFGNDDPDAFRLLKNRVSPTWAALHLPARKDFNRRLRVCQSFIQRDHANDAVKLIQHVGMVLRQVT